MTSNGPTRGVPTEKRWGRCGAQGQPPHPCTHPSPASDQRGPCCVPRAGTVSSGQRGAPLLPGGVWRMGREMLWHVTGWIWGCAVGLWPFLSRMGGPAGCSFRDPMSVCDRREARGAKHLLLRHLHFRAVLSNVGAAAGPLHPPWSLCRRVSLCRLPSAQCSVRWDLGRPLAEGT